MEEHNKPARHKKWSFKESLYFNIGTVFLAVPCFITSVMGAESVYHPQPIKILIYISLNSVWVPPLLSIPVSLLLRKRHPKAAIAVLKYARIPLILLGIAAAIVVTWVEFDKIRPYL